jgi:hypothetical protein
VARVLDVHQVKRNCFVSTCGARIRLFVKLKCPGASAKRCGDEHPICRVVADTIHLALERETFVRRVENMLIGAGSLTDDVADLEARLNAGTVTDAALIE